MYKILIQCLIDPALYYFFQLEIKGGAALDMEGEDVKVVAHQVAGDNTGRAVVHRTQSFNLTQDRALMEFAVVSQRESFVQLPPKTDCRKIDFIIKGWCLKEEKNGKIHTSPLNFQELQWQRMLIVLLNM